MFVHFWNVFPSQGPDCQDHSSFCPHSSSGPDDHASRCHSAHAHCQVSVYLHLSLGPEGSNSCVIVYIWDQPDTLPSLSPMAIHAVEFLNNTTFHFGLKIAILCFRQMPLQLLGPGRDITLLTVSQPLGANCLWGAVYILSLQKHNLLMLQWVFSFQVS